MNPEPADDVRLIPLAEAARIVRLKPEEMIELARATADWGIYRVSIFHGLGGPFFDADECEGLNLLMEWEEAGESNALSHEPPKLVIKTQ